VVLFAVASYTRSFVIYLIAIKAGNNMHNKMTQRIINAPVSFFDSNPLGRILTRFSKDIMTVDYMMPAMTAFTIFGFFRILGIIIFAAISVPFTVVISIVVIFFMNKARKFAIKSMNETQRLESMTKGPLNDQIIASMTGILSIRAYNQKSHFIKKFSRDQDINADYMFTSSAVSGWLGLRLDMYAIAFILSLCVSFVSMKNYFNPSLLSVGL
jgi:ATP-binding cassette subfamily C (CFTR/MRP) protein 4